MEWNKHALLLLRSQLNLPNRLRKQLLPITNLNCTELKVLLGLVRLGTTLAHVELSNSLNAPAAIDASRLLVHLEEWVAVLCIHLGSDGG